MEFGHLEGVPQPSFSSITIQQVSILNYTKQKKTKMTSLSEFTQIIYTPQKLTCPIDKGLFQ